MAEELPYFEAFYPQPPPFWRLFTSQSQSDLEHAKSQPDYDPSTLPYDLKILTPPPLPPAQNSYYKIYNHEQHIPPRPGLPDPDSALIDFEALTTTSNSSQRESARKLWHLTKSLLLNFLELCSVMGSSPEEWNEKLVDVNVLMRNINGVINVLRPHQGREALKVLLERNIEEGREEMERLDSMKGEIEGFLGGLKEEDSEMGGMNGHAEGSEEERKKMVEARKVWDALDEISDDED